MRTMELNTVAINIAIVLSSHIYLYKRIKYMIYKTIVKIFALIYIREGRIWIQFRSETNIQQTNQGKRKHVRVSLFLLQEFNELHYNLQFNELKSLD